MLSLLLNCDPLFEQQLKSFGFESIKVIQNLEDLTESDFPCVLFRDLSFLDFDPSVLKKCDRASCLIELTESGPYTLSESNELVARDKSVDGFEFIGAFVFTDLCEISFLETPSKFNPITSGRQGKFVSKSDYRSCLFLDRDGILNHDGSYLYEFEAMSFYDEIIPLLKYIQDQNYFLCVVTNQSGVARGYYSSEDVDTLHKKMKQYFYDRGVEIESWLQSPYHETKGQGAYRRKSHLRKPYPGMVSKAFQQMPILSTGNLMIGDKVSDDLLAFHGNVFHMIRQYDLSTAKNECFDNYDLLQKRLELLFQTLHNV
ncbi:HAD-IIIA family hydrolase [Halobacteriovorax sp. GB3]|uniref:HAD-IIIA family hydrolase n=1 Tax=Halobacteriovorax sp. GB3 TaxID=2719615 RepID=UPI00235E03DD|nr:HAD-IIIA family hydrolase [Halobacteriovorax sp. GB3]MDD0853055.1 HAD-IIIA family hydrolase [Halobacteriovorax sp. GB3]